ncbi:MAG: hypothetical protein WCX65_16405 [bacterium]
MGISEKTATAHVSDILRKLHLEARTKAAAFAWKQGRNIFSYYLPFCCLSPYMEGL